MKIEVLNPLDRPDWDLVLLRAPGASFFHSSAWAKVLSESYGYTPQHFTLTEEGRLRALVPIMEVNSFLTGKRGVSLPFTDYCDPILDGGMSFHDLFNQIVEFGRRRKWKYVELRGAHNLSPMSPWLIRYLGHTLDLTKGEKALYSGLRDSTRRNVKKAEKEKVQVRMEDSLKAVKEFYSLNCMTRREHGLPPQPFHFFRRVHRDVISRGNGFVALAYFRGETVSGNMYFHFGDQGIYKYGASNKAYQHLRANNLVMWEAIRWFANKGFKSLCLGRTELENEGLRQFKNGWGAEESQIQYFRYDLRKGGFVTGKKKGEPAYADLFRTIPMPVLNVIGSMFYRHMG